MTSQTRPRVLANASWDPTFFDPTRPELEAAGVDLVLTAFRTPAELLAAAQDVDAIVESAVPIDREVIQQLPRLKALCALGIGVDRFDVEAATEHGVVVINLPRVFHREVAQHAMALLLALVRKVVPLNAWMKARAGSTEPPPRRDRGMLPGHHLYGETLGLVSFGNIPRVVAGIARAFEMNVIAHDPFVPQSVADEHGVRMVSLDDLFREADFVSAHTPLSKQTYHMIGEAQFRLMKPTSLFINTGRGPVVDEAALIKALQEGWLAGAALDVQEKEPPDSDNPLLRMDNVIVTPHVASSSNKARVERGRWVGIELGRVLTGQRPVHGLVNKSVTPKLPLR